MQLTGLLHGLRSSLGLRLNPVARTLLALGVIAAPVLGGVLPEDRFDFMWHSYNGGDISVDGPSVLIQKKVTDNLAFSANYYEDMISSASIDVKLSASPYKETRRQWSGGVEYINGKSTYNLGVITSKEPDYKSNTVFASVSQDMFGDLTTLTLGFRRGWDQIYRDIKDPNGEIVNDPTFFERADHRGYSFGLSQILSRNTIASFNYELVTDQGYLANPYRKIRYLSPGVGEGYTLADQVYPDTRTSNAASLSVKHYLKWDASVTGMYRYYTDTWGVVGNTLELDYVQPWHRLTFDASVRYYKQNAADFYSDLFPRADYQNFMARDRELAAFNDWTLGGGVAYQFPHPSWAPWMKLSSLNFHYERLMISYSDFRNALLAPQYGAGNEPFYRLDADVFTAFFSIWF